MQIKRYGHACFLLTFDGAAVLTDPCDPSTGYVLHGIAADAVTASHAHHDHNYFEAAAGDPRRIETAGTHLIKGGALRITGLPTYHDAVQGAKRGGNLVFVIEGDGLRAVHAGDLGHMPSEKTLNAIGTPDVLFVPVGGVYTIDAAEALRLVSRLRPRTVVPMHYQTPVLTFRLEPPDAFLQGVCALGYTIRRVTGDTCPLQAGGADAPTALLFAD